MINYADPRCRAKRESVCTVLAAGENFPCTYTWVLGIMTRIRLHTHRVLFRACVPETANMLGEGKVCLYTNPCFFLGLLPLIAAHRAAPAIDFRRHQIGPTAPKRLLIQYAKQGSPPTFLSRMVQKFEHSTSGKRVKGIPGLLCSFGSTAVFPSCPPALHVSADLVCKNRYRHIYVPPQVLSHPIRTGRPVK